VFGPGAPIQRVSDIGGALVDVTKKIDGQSRFQPQFLPDWRHFIYYVIGGSSQTNGVYVAPLATTFEPGAGKVLFPFRGPSCAAAMRWPATAADSSSGSRSMKTSVSQ
jgi:hypothetical protein